MIIAEFACATGYQAFNILAKYGEQIKHAYLSDISPKMIELAKKRLSNHIQDNKVSVENRNVVEYESDKKFDLVIASLLIH